MVRVSVLYSYFSFSSYDSTSDKSVTPFEHKKQHFYISDAVYIKKSYQMLPTYLSDSSLQELHHFTFYSNKKLFQSRKMLISFSRLFKWKSSKVSLRFYKFTYKFSHDILSRGSCRNNDTNQMGKKHNLIIYLSVKTEKYTRIFSTLFAIFQ